ncbi:cysteine--tRNA ligase [candidate division WWE3 bacterium RIFOXYC1_FULL_40_10]|uniref:Cysteine--tRNA ligase n=1 Tax=candidate division WWE3 bacterium RIFOXYA2_FULL_46_9 TaxID=1802636 RepID=A0A1F4W213_UNCKA|nr:MAG: cysteine--tRNA ligase [candidate division WWE3 bacterium RIFOXYB1_FULL_40_22]OGC62185.1 MAG: cysteine--tRNA ligase [candidate division WWE3 bacterium RIFOXYA1_FULL_40_11]OGC63452.1 MAG: cysteine--tRNA ligase [candidate division WWE3 bacterium RIFOXYA2_FULL_46_9]OGC66568.1 MAG: cysteine--tRNA ligase [candidate division WWE3 bacterium RIFOXYC1_FULL_40_10]OGC67395.1 MAG: cysteine--tRNA ligase [candidate division WWE3 bacterium RIFOXYC2_FULL_40_11]OGC71278.1 MAG: cysteine--tRNA ligase [can
MKIYNSLSRKAEDFKPYDLRQVLMYTCGPTVYSYPTIGNYRTYILGDILLRTLKFNGYIVKYVMNLTDVGHLSGDNLGDADTGEDRVEKAALEEGKTAKEITDFYINAFMKDLAVLNISTPSKFTRATEYITQQIALIQQLEEKGYTYATKDGIYFDTAKFKNYGKLSGMSSEQILEGARVEPNPEKRNPADFALWKFSAEGTNRLQEWNSPWGIGFPGWHIECSAMAINELGESIDVHLGGEDLRMIHHQNEIAQSECATEKTFSKYWMHGAFLQVDGKRMGKSEGNAYTIEDVVGKGFKPLALRYFYFGAHYRTQQNFTWEALENAQNSLLKIYEILGSYKLQDGMTPSQKYRDLFEETINDDLNMPQALAVFWDLLKSSLPESEKLLTALELDKVLGIGLEQNVAYIVPSAVMDLAKTRDQYRKSGIWDKADKVRKELFQMGYVVEDKSDGTFRVKKQF